MTADDFGPAPHDLRMAEEASQDRRTATERGLAGVQRHETGETTPEAPSGGLREAVAREILAVVFQTTNPYAPLDDFDDERAAQSWRDVALAMADAAILAMANYPHRGEKR